ncbi:MAG: M67 family metallopeptidase [Oscillospiraceae bacterium]|jgi:proteasome lid subunit RPN8/RPN11|nr:M67 family metallopeptidase [Oscillospiraceae bacterium]
MIILPEILAARIREEGERSYPDECCGAVFGTATDDGAKSAVSILPVDNARDDGESYHRFVITAEDYLKAELEARSRRLDIIGFYHSHPDHPAEPSEYDKEHALPFYSYAIVSVNNGAAAELTSWELAPDRSVFYNEEILEGSQT